jgi:hypothetical protein
MFIGCGADAGFNKKLYLKFKLNLVQVQTWSFALKKTTDRELDLV